MDYSNSMTPPFFAENFGKNPRDIDTQKLLADAAAADIGRDTRPSRQETYRNNKQQASFNP